MPIYEYLCGACGHEEEVIQKMSDQPLTKCPACKKNKLQKQVSATAFQLKGEGWYVTDFKDKKPAAKTETKVETTTTVSSTETSTTTEAKVKSKESPHKKADKKTE